MAEPPASERDLVLEAYEKGIADGRVLGYQQGLETAQAQIGELLTRSRQLLLLETVDKIHDTPIDEMGFDVRVTNALRRDGINSLSALLRMSYEELLRIRGLGPRSLEQVMRYLRRHNYTIPETTIERIKL